MERTEVLDMMGELKLYGMRGAYDETLAVAVKRGASNAATPRPSASAKILRFIEIPSH